MRNHLLSRNQLISRRPGLRRRLSCAAVFETLENRQLLSGNVLQTNLVSDLPGVAQQLDSQLVNPWGIATSSTSPFWISDNNAGVSTLYNTAGTKQGLVVSIPTPPDPLGASGAPTGAVNTAGAGGFKVSGFSKTGTPTSASAAFLFATEDGTIVGWNPGVNPAGFDPTKAGTYGIIAVDNSGNNFTNPDPAQETGAVYKGLAISPASSTPIIGSDPASTSLLYASNFRAGTIDVYDTNFNKPVLPAGAFTDNNLPKGFAPFDVQVLNGQVYVTYALQNQFKHDDLAGPHNGFVDVYNLDGTGGKRLISGGPLDSPWGLAIAPPSYGALAGDLLVGNFGNGRINAFNLNDSNPSNHFTPLTDPDGEPIQISGLWALRVGNGGNGGDANLVYFTAGLFGESHGLFGSLTSVAPGTPEGPAENQLVTAAQDVVQLDLNALGSDIAAKAPEAAIQQDLATLRADTLQFVQFQDQFLDETNAPPPAITYLNGTLFITDLSNHNDHIEVSAAPNGGATVTSDLGSATFAQVTSVLVSLGSGNDRVRVGDLPGASVVVDAADGNNHIRIGNEATTVVAVGAGNNRITTAAAGPSLVSVIGDGNNQIFASAGQNVIDLTGRGNNQIAAIGASNSINLSGNGNNDIDADGVNDSIAVTGNGNNNIDDDGTRVPQAGFPAAHGPEGIPHAD